MKKIFIITLMFIIILAFFSIAYGNNLINISLNKKDIQTKEVFVNVNNKKLLSDVPSFILENRTLVPIRFIAENFGAEVLWDQNTKSATINHDKNKIVLAIDKDNVIVNGEIKQLDNNSIPRLVTFKDLKDDTRTMVPVRFISEILGYDVLWDNSTYTVNINSKKENINEINNIGIIGLNNEKQIVISSTKEVKYKKMFLPNTNKLVIDIENTKLNIGNNFDKPEDIPLEDEYIKRVQYSQFEITPNLTTRIVLTLKEEKEPIFLKSNDGKTTTIFFNEESYKETNDKEPGDKEESVEEDIEVVDLSDIIDIDNEKKDKDKDKKNDVEIEYIDGVNYIQSISTEKINNKDAIVITGLDEIDYNNFKVSEPNRIVIDMQNMILSGDKLQEMPVSMKFINKLRVSQYIPDIENTTENTVRVVLDIDERYERYEVSILKDKNKLIIFPEDSLWDNLIYENKTLQGYFTIKNNYNTAYNTTYDSIKKELIIDIPTAATNIPQCSEDINDNLVKNIIVEKDLENTRIIISFRKSTIYGISSNPTDKDITIITTRNENIKPKDRTIIIDAGHGGKDSGALFGTLYEKDINLRYSLSLRDYLMSLGYNVIMTRDSDVFIDLHERPRIANSYNADLFVSVHTNSTLSSKVNGLEVLYCPANACAIKSEDQYPFANVIHESIVNELKRVSRGVIKRPELVVLNKTTMPAVLVEVGYISNEEERGLMQTEDYQNKIVNGIVNGIVKYFNEY